MPNPDKEIDPLQRPCLICNKPKRICGGHGGGSGGGGGGGDDAPKGNNSSIGNTVGTATNGPSIATAPVKDWAPVLSKSDGTSDLTDVEALLEEKLLTIELKPQNGTLTFRADSDLSESEQEAVQNFFGKVIAEFKDFTAELKAQGISVDNFTFDQNQKDNTLTIRIPEPQYFKAFIQRLVDNGLLPKAYAQPQDKPQATPFVTSLFTTPKPDPTAANIPATEPQKNIGPPRSLYSLPNPGALPRLDRGKQNI